MYRVSAYSSFSQNVLIFAEILNRYQGNFECVNFLNPCQGCNLYRGMAFSCDPLTSNTV